MIVNVLILLVGLAVYASYGVPFLYLVSITLLSYMAGRLIPKHRWAMWISVALQGAILLWFRVQPLAGWREIAAPLGLSYFTLQIIAYHADLYQGKYGPEKNLLRYGLFVTYLPHIFIGPIEPYPKMMDALGRRHFSWDGISMGAARAMWGLWKKLAIAARLGVIVSAISADPEQFRGAYALAAMLLYSIELYADFSGGIDIALGVSGMLGIRLEENFNAPYFSESVKEFWQRWHITLGLWLRDYIYIPLGGNRRGKLRKWVNTLVTFLVSGIWHGGHYLLWGLLNGILVSCGDRFRTRSKTCNRIVTFLLISFLWSFFIWPDTLSAARMIGSVFTVFNYGGLLAGIGAMGLAMGDWIVLAAACLLLLICDAKRQGIRDKMTRFSPAARLGVICLLALAVMVFGRYGIGFTASEFIYSRF